MAQRFQFDGRRRVKAVIEHTRAQFLSALNGFERAVDLADEVKVESIPSKVESARLDGYLSAIEVMSSTELLNEHPDVRAAVIAELERRAHVFCEHPLPDPPDGD